MKKKYVQPELNMIVFDVKDIITVSYATSGGDNSQEFDQSNWVPGGGIPGKNPFG